MAGWVARSAWRALRRERPAAFPIRRTSGARVFDEVEVTRSGVVRVHGWTSGDVEDFADVRLFANTEEIPRLATYRVWRPDVSAMARSAHVFPGVVIEFLLRLPGNPSIGDLRLETGDQLLWRSGAPRRLQIPAYDGLFSAREVLRRDNIYGSGPPIDAVDEQIFALARQLQGPLLDFGCGAGALVRRLRQTGIEAHGLEIERPQIQTALQPDVRDFVTLYSGDARAPFADDAFNSVVAVEVLEHIPDYETALAEIARLTRHQILITVPDISAIPLCFEHAVVPWHLLEATHVNFFTQESLAGTLRKYFRKVEICRYGQALVNGTRYFTGLVALGEEPHAG